MSFTRPLDAVHHHPDGEKQSADKGGEVNEVHTRPMCDRRVRWGQARREKLAHAPFSKIERMPRPAPANESNVAAVFNKFQLETIIPAAIACTS